MFRTMLLSAWTLLHLYVFWRVASVPQITRRVPKKIIFAAGLLLWASFFIFRGHGHGDQGLLIRYLEQFGMNWIAVLFLTSTSLLAADLVTGFGFLLPRLAPGLRGLALVAGMVLSLIAFVQGQRPPVVSNHEVRLAGLPQELDGTVLVAISDLHLGDTLDGKWLAARIEQINALRPDLVVLLGDFFEGHSPPDDNLLPILRRIDPPMGAWAVNGNHESHRDREPGIGLLEEAGIQLLIDRWAQAAPGLILAGVDDLTSQRRRGQGGDHIGRALASRPPGAAILLSHSPLQAERAAGAGAGLMLSGHTHGGQIWPFGLVIRIFYPLVAGRHEVDGMPVIVCRGTGTWGTRMRLWLPGEILKVTLNSAGPR